MSKYRLLVVDDEAPIRNAWAKFLRHKGHVVIEAGSADDALAKADEHVFDLVLLDFIMPSMDGIELLALLRRKQPFLRSIIVSGRIDPEINPADLTKKLNEAVEADEYLHKPLPNPELEAAIESVMGRKVDEGWPQLAERVQRAGKSRLGPVRRIARTLKNRKHRKK